MSSVKDNFPGIFEIDRDQVGGNGLDLPNAPIRPGRIDHELTRFQKSVQDMHFRKLTGQCLADLRQDQRWEEFIMNDMQKAIHDNDILGLSVPTRIF